VKIDVGDVKDDGMSSPTNSPNSYCGQNAHTDRLQGTLQIETPTNKTGIERSTPIVMPKCIKFTKMKPQINGGCFSIYKILNTPPTDNGIKID